MTTRSYILFLTALLWGLTGCSSTESDPETPAAFERPATAVDYEVELTGVTNERARELMGGQTCVTPNVATFEAEATKPWMDKFYTINDDWVAEDRRKLLAYGRDLLNSDYAGHRLAFQLFAQSAPFAQLGAVYRNFDWDGPLDFVKKSAGLSDKVLKDKGRPAGDGAVTQWFDENLPKAAE